jgi:hypothetical protein
MLAARSPVPPPATPACSSAPTAGQIAGGGGAPLPDDLGGHVEQILAHPLVLARALAELVRDPLDEHLAGVQAVGLPRRRQRRDLLLAGRELLAAVPQVRVEQVLLGTVATLPVALELGVRVRPRPLVGGPQPVEACAGDRGERDTERQRAGAESQ